MKDKKIIIQLIFFVVIILLILGIWEITRLIKEPASQESNKSEVTWTSREDSLPNESLLAEHNERLQQVKQAAAGSIVPVPVSNSDYTGTATVMLQSTARKDCQIPVYISLPEDYDETETYPLVIMLPDYLNDHNIGGGFDYIVKELNSYGIIVSMLDFPSMGESSDTFLNYNLHSMEDDTMDMLNYIFANYSIAEVGGFGYSLGGRIILEMILDQVVDFDLILLIAPAADTEDIRNYFGGKDEWNDLASVASEKGSVTKFGRTFSDAWFEDWERFPTPLGKDVSKIYSNPSMVIYSTEDLIIAPKTCDDLAKALGSAIPVYSCDHGYGLIFSNDYYTMKLINDTTLQFFSCRIGTLKK